MENQNNQENTSGRDQADGKFDGNVKQEQLAKGVTADADAQVRETEDASLPDDAYSFDEDNTDNEEYHDAGDLGDSDLTDVFDANDDGLQ